MNIDIDQFLDEKPYSKSTRDQYRRVLSAIGSKYDMAYLTAIDLRQWLDERGWGTAMQWMAYSAIRAYLRWRYGPEHQALNLKIRRMKSGPQRTVTPQMAAKLIRMLSASNDDISIRDLAIVELLLDTGLRESEICRLEIGRVNLYDGSLSVICKGGEWGVGVYSQVTANAIRNWLAERRHIAVNGERALFVSLGGCTPGHRLTPSGLRVIARRWGGMLGCQISPHDFRRGFATIATKAKAPSRLVQLAGRWGHIEMVEHYTRDLEIDDFREYLPVDYITEQL